MLFRSLFVDVGTAAVSGTSIYEFTKKYPGVTIQDFSNYDLNTVKIPTCSVAWDEGYPTFNEYGTYVQTSNVPSTTDAGYLATGAIVYGVTTSGFPTSGVLQVGKELITYTSKLSDRFIGCTRGAYGTTISRHNIGDYMRSTAAPV